MDSGHVNAYDLVGFLYTISIPTEHLNYEQVALMLSGMGSASSDVFRMVRINLRDYSVIYMFKGFLLTFCLHFVDIFGVDESLIACDMVEIIIFCMPYNMAKA